MGKRIVMADKTGKPIALFSSIEDACAQTSFSKNEILRCLVGTQSYVSKKEIHFFYETTAGELRQAAQSRRNKKLKEKLEKEWKI